MQNTNTIHGLFYIPDEESYLKKLILSHPTTYNPDIPLAFKALKEIYPELELIQKQHYFSLFLPTHSPGLSLEAMLITTDDTNSKLLSIYHRLHFDETLYPQGPRLIEADAFLHLDAVMVNIPYKNRQEGLKNLLNYQVQEALNIEISMLCLADADVQIIEEDPQPFIHNTIGRYTLACQLDDVEYVRPQDTHELARLISRYCDLPLENCVKGLQDIIDLQRELLSCEELFLPEFASSTVCMMLLLLEQRTSSALLDEGGIKSIKEFFLRQREIFELQEITAKGESLGSFRPL